MNKIKELFRRRISEEAFEGICHTVCCILLAAAIIILLVMPFVRLRLPRDGTFKEECGGDRAAVLMPREDRGAAQVCYTDLQDG